MPAANPDDVLELIRLMRMDLTQLQARVTDLAKMLSALDLPKGKTYPCTECVGGLEFASQSQLREHLVNVHDWEQLDLDADAEERRAHAAKLREQFAGLGEPTLVGTEPRLA